jgi:rhamnulokinase
LLKKARDLLFIPDLINYFLGGIKCTEFSFATTSQLYNPRQKGWDEILLAKMDIPPGLLQEIVQPGTRIGSLKKDIADQTGAGKISLHSVVSHDTGSAVAAAPGKGRQWAYISSGTWSLLGVETDKPLISPLSRTLNFTNEGGVNSTFRLQKNITGLWILQQLRQSEAALADLSYSEIMEQVMNAPQFAALIDPDEEGFNNPADMGEAMTAYCRDTGQILPGDPFSRVRVFMESLALKYRFCLEQLARIYPHPIKHLHIIGGGSKNRLLNQFTANATGKHVYAGPGEATSIGNILVQALAGGRIKSIEAGRQLIRDSFAIEKYEPKDLSLWDKAYNRFKEIIQRG